MVVSSPLWPGYGDWYHRSYLHWYKPSCYEALLIWSRRLLRGGLSETPAFKSTSDISFLNLWMAAVVPWIDAYFATLSFWSLGSACVWYRPLLGCCCLSKADLTSSFALRMDEDGTSLESGPMESGPQGSGIPAGDFSVDVIDFLAK